VRGCACRGDSAGFVHLECLIEYADRDEENPLKRSLTCVDCKQDFTGALQWQVYRDWWRRHRDDSLEPMRLIVSCNLLSNLLGAYGEKDAAKRLINNFSDSARSFNEMDFNKLNVASRMAEERPEGALKLMEEVLSQAKQDGDLKMAINAQGHIIRELHRLERYEETVAMATECLESAMTSCGVSSDAGLIQQKHACLCMFATLCGMTGRFDESKRAFDELIASATRILGRDHQDTRGYFCDRAILLQKMVVKARDLVVRGDQANCAKHLDAVLIESKARDFFDAKDRNVGRNYITMVLVAALLGKIGRDQESLAVARLCLKSARERKDLDSETNQKCMLNYARVSYKQLDRLEETKEVLDELLAIQTRLYGPDAPQTQGTLSFLSSLLQH